MFIRPSQVLCMLHADVCVVLFVGRGQASSALLVSRLVHNARRRTVVYVSMCGVVCTIR